MSLEAVVFPQDPFGSYWSYEFDKDEDHHHHQDFPGNQTEIFPYNYYDDFWNYSSLEMDPNFNELLLHQPNIDFSSSETATTRPDDTIRLDSTINALQSSGARPRRPRRSKSRKNKEEIENQRMTHITVERNRRKQMNEYLSVLRSIMPDSYVQRGDQASIIGGAINFVKELEQQVHFLSAQTDVKGNPNSSFPFSNFFTSPQYSTTSTPPPPPPRLVSDTDTYPAPYAVTAHDHRPDATMSNQIQSSVADIEVTMVDSHANLKIRTKKLPKQLLKLVSGLQTMHLTVLHLNVSTVDQIVLYSLSVKVEEECSLSSVDEIARALYQLLSRIQEEAFSS